MRHRQGPGHACWRPFNSLNLHSDGLRKHMRPAIRWRTLRVARDVRKPIGEYLFDRKVFNRDSLSKQYDTISVIKISRADAKAKSSLAEKRNKIPVRWAVVWKIQGSDDSGSS